MANKFKLGTLSKRNAKSTRIKSNRLAISKVLKTKLYNIEIWKDIPGYEGYYQISTLGDVRSLNRFVKRRGGSYYLQGRILKLINDTKGYLQVNLSKAGKHTIYKVHKLMIITFITKDYKPLIIDHKDNNSMNNNINNLQLITHRCNLLKDNKPNSKEHYISITKYNKYHVAITINKKRIYVGSYDNLDDAIKYRDLRLKELRINIDI